MNRLEPAQTLPQAQPSKRGPWRLLWLAAGLTALGLLLGVLGLYLSAWSCPDLSSASLSDYYWDTPALWYLNLLPGVILIWLFYFLTGRCWLAYLASALLLLGLAAANYYKIQLRGDPLLASDLALISEAGDMAGRTIRRDLRLFGLFSAIAVAATAFGGLYCNEDLYEQTQAGEDLVNPWIDAEAYLSHGAVYAFLHTVQDLVPHPPERYDPQAAQAILESYAEADIPEEQEVNVVGIMLEAFCDLTDFPALADHEAVQAVYEPWHQLEEESVSGNLLTNIFAGGTVDTEWGFLTGYSQHQDFTKATDSYVWYFARQGYQTRGGHPGFGWFYDRENVNWYLGFQEYWFTDNHYGELVDPVEAQWNSDYILTGEIVKDLQAQLEESRRPVFSFSVSYQNHGPYEEDHTSLEVYLDPEADGLPEESCNVFNNYLHGINLTIDAVTAMVDELEAMDEPVVLVLFGDHKPWGGNGNSAYAGIGADFDLSTLEGFLLPLLFDERAVRAVRMDRPRLSPVRGGDPLPHPPGPQPGPVPDPRRGAHRRPAPGGGRPPAGVPVGGVLPGAQGGPHRRHLTRSICRYSPANAETNSTQQRFLTSSGPSAAHPAAEGPFSTPPLPPWERSPLDGGAESG